MIPVTTFSAVFIITSFRSILTRNWEQNSDPLGVSRSAEPCVLPVGIGVLLKDWMTELVKGSDSSIAARIKSCLMGSGVRCL